MLYDVIISCYYSVTVEAENEKEAMEIAPYSEDYDISMLYGFEAEEIIGEYANERRKVG